MKVRSQRGESDEVDAGALRMRDLHDGTQWRSLSVDTDDTVTGMRIVAGDFEAVMQAARVGHLFRYVVFPAKGDLAELQTAYEATFGALAEPLVVAKAILLDAAANALVSLSVWADQAALDQFLQHPEFRAHLNTLRPLIAGRPSAESLRVVER